MERSKFHQLYLKSTLDVKIAGQKGLFQTAVPEAVNRTMSVHTEACAAPFLRRSWMSVELHGLAMRRSGMRRAPGLFARSKCILRCERFLKHELLQRVQHMIVVS